MKYHKMIVKNYIDGKDNMGYKINDLEKDKDFLMQVADLANDKNTYNLLSEEDKRTFEVAKFFINKFNSDRDFILTVAENYFFNKEFSLEDEEYIEILILMDKYKENIEYDIIKEIPLKLKTELFYNTVSKAVKKMVDEEAGKTYSKEYLGTGFIYMETIYENNKVIRDYLAKRKVEEIFPEYNTLEKYLHIKYTKEDFTKKGVYNFIINYLFEIDESLSKHISCNLELASSVRDNIVSILENWSNYSDEEEQNICDFISNYYNEKSILEISEIQLFDYLGKKLNKKELIEHVEVLKKEEKEAAEEMLYGYNEDMDDILDSKSLFDNYLPIIITEDAISLDSLSTATVNKINELEILVKDMYKNGYEDDYIRKAKEENKYAKIIKFPTK